MLVQKTKTRLYFRHCPEPPMLGGVYPTLANNFQELNGPKVTDIYIYYKAWKDQIIFLL